MTDLSKGALFPVLPLRDIVVFPHMIVPLFVGREKSVRALEDVMKDDKQILLVTQKDAGEDDPSPEDLFTVGTVGTILQLRSWSRAVRARQSWNSPTMRISSRPSRK